MDRRDVVDKALEVLSVVGLPDLTMRRLGAELGVQQSALYHHFANKQALLGAVADEIVARGPRPSGEGLDDWADLVRERCADLRGAVLAYPDGADVVASMFAFGLGGAEPFRELVEILGKSGLADVVVEPAARTLLHYVYGHAVAQQAHEQAARLGAIPAEALPEDFGIGLDLVVDGIRAQLA